MSLYESGSPVSGSSWTHDARGLLFGSKRLEPQSDRRQQYVWENICLISNKIHRAASTADARKGDQKGRTLRDTSRFETGRASPLSTSAELLENVFFSKNTKIR